MVLGCYIGVDKRGHRIRCQTAYLGCEGPQLHLLPISNVAGVAVTPDKSISISSTG
jgi:hypothetical protein